MYERESVCVCIRVWIWDFCEFEALTGFQGILQLSCLRPIGGALTLSAGGMAAAEATREHSSPEPVCSSSLSLHTHIHLGTGDGAASSLPLSLDQVCALSSLEAGLRLGVPSAFSWEPQGGWNLGSQEGPGEEDPVTALLTPVRGSAIQEIPQGKAGGGTLESCSLGS